MKKLIECWGTDNLKTFNILDKIEKIRIKNQKELEKKKEQLVQDLIDRHGSDYESTEALLKEFYATVVIELENKEQTIWNPMNTKPYC